MASSFGGLQLTLAGARQQHGEELHRLRGSDLDLGDNAPLVEIVSGVDAGVDGDPVRGLLGAPGKGAAVEHEAQEIFEPVAYPLAEPLVVLGEDVILSSLDRSVAQLDQQPP